MEIIKEEGYRIFFSIDLPKTIHLILEQIIFQIKQVNKDKKINWHRATHPHITLQFQHAIKKAEIAILVQTVRNELDPFKFFYLELNKIELFPTSHRPHIVSLTVAPQDILVQLAGCIGKAIVALGYQIDRRPFYGHITLLRIKKPVSLEGVVMPKITGFYTKKIILYRSVPTHGGFEHIPLEEFIL